MKNYYYIGTHEYTVTDFVYTFKREKYDKNRLFKLNNIKVFSTDTTYSSVLYGGLKYMLRTNITLQDKNMNVLCYYLDE